MKTVILDEFVFPTEDKHIFAHGFRSGLVLQYYEGEDTGFLINWTPTYHRHLGCERVRVDTTTPNRFALYHNPLTAFGQNKQ